jgi:hypothetical protein
MSKQAQAAQEVANFIVYAGSLYRSLLLRLKDADEERIERFLSEHRKEMHGLSLRCAQLGLMIDHLPTDPTPAQTHNPRTALDILRRLGSSYLILFSARTKEDIAGAPLLSVEMLDELMKSETIDSWLRVNYRPQDNG